MATFYIFGWKLLNDIHFYCVHTLILMKYTHQLARNQIQIYKSHITYNVTINTMLLMVVINSHNGIEVISQFLLYNMTCAWVL
jgi:hypothetical protein